MLASSWLALWQLYGNWPGGRRAHLTTRAQYLQHPTARRIRIRIRLFSWFISVFHYFSYICNILRYVIFVARRIIRDFPVWRFTTSFHPASKRTLGKFSTFDIWHFGATSRNFLKVATIRTHYKLHDILSSVIVALQLRAQASSISFSSYNEHDKVRVCLVT